MKRPEIAELDAFLAVAEQASFSKAADRLGLARSTLSETIRGLEERLGVRLLNRTTRSVSLTDAGRQLVERLRPALDDLAAALEGVNRFRDRPAGNLRITAAPPAVESILAPLVSRFLQAYPEIRLEISAESGLVNIVAEHFDAGIRPGGLVERDMIAVRISPPVRAVVAASPAYLAQRPAPQRPRDLAAHDCIGIRFQSGVLLPWRFRQDGEDLEVAVEGSLICNDGPLALRAAIEGVGLIWVLRDTVTGELADGRLVEVLRDYVPEYSSWFLYSPSRRHVPAPLQALIDFLKRNLRDGGAG